jgi:hypothetical protein
MSRKRPEGVCRICGREGPLSFEHIPPKAAFNDRPVIVLKFEETLKLGPDEVAKGPIQQRGMGYYTLCEQCNNNTGAWYGKQFIDWCYQGMEILRRTNGNPSLINLNYLLPLPILKQIVTMFFSVHPETFSIPNEELVRFILNKEEKYLSPKYRFFVYFNTRGRPRSFGGGGLLNFDTGSITIISEITFPPFGYVMTINSGSPDPRLAEITHFAQYGYKEFVVMEVKLPVLPTYLPTPGDYREIDQIHRESGIQPTKEPS